jgi:hypothetical protein
MANFKVTLPAALPGLIAALMLGLGRGIGRNNDRIGIPEMHLFCRGIF